jgi:hypothetical protein
MLSISLSPVISCTLKGKSLKGSGYCEDLAIKPKKLLKKT